MNKKMQVFVSSTYLDLKIERQSAVEAILKAGHIPAGMELFASGDESQLETIKRWIDNSDIFMLILGSRYGSIEPKSRKSYIEVEYDYAVEKGKPLFAVVITEKAIDDKVKGHGKDVIEQDNAPKLKKFKGKVLSKTSTFFDEPKDIKLAVFESIANLEKKYNIKGWVRSEAIQETKPLLNEINRLSKAVSKFQKENNKLKNELDQLKESTKEENEFEEIIRKLKAKKIRYKLLAETDIETGEYTVLYLFYAFKDSLLVGVCNDLNMKTKLLDQYVFFNLAPELHIYDLVENTGVSNVAFRRYGITQKGVRFLSYCERKNLF